MWVVELLRSIARPVDDGLLIFKGGTSLSKAYGIIERFSEGVEVPALRVPLCPQHGAGASRAIRVSTTPKAIESVRDQEG